MPDHAPDLALLARDASQEASATADPAAPVTEAPSTPQQDDAADDATVERMAAVIEADPELRQSVRVRDSARSEPAAALAD